ELPLTEDSKLTENSSPYSQSKKLMEEAAQNLRSQGLDCVVARPFNHIGPGQLGGFLVPDLYEKIRVASKSGGNILVGNLKTKRDYTDVRDIVKAYADLAASETLDYDVYNVCSGQSRSGEEIL